MAHSFLTSLQQNWSVVSTAPWVFVGIVVTSLVVAWTIIGHLKGTQFESLQARLSLRDDENAELRRRLESAQPAESAKRIAELERAVAELRPRRFSDEQIMALTAKIREAPGRVTVVNEMGYSDGQVLSEQLVRAFQQSGWQVSSGAIAGPPFRPVEGILFSKQSAMPTDADKAAMAGFAAAGIPFALGPEGMDQGIEIRVIQPIQ